MQQVNPPTFLGFKLIPLLLTPLLGMSILKIPVRAQASSSLDASTGSAEPSTASPLATESPALAVPKPASTVTSAPTPTPATTSSSSSEAGSGAYIDKTDYSIGATQPARVEATAGSPKPRTRRTAYKGEQEIRSSVSGSGRSVGDRPLKTITASLISRAAIPQAGSSSGYIRSATSPAKVGFSGSTTATTPAKIVSHSLSSLSVRLVPLERPNLKPGRWLPGDGYLTFPLAVPAAITSAFGWRIHPITGTQRFHSGTDLGAPMGTPVLAAYAGKVAIADFLGGYGLSVLLSHNHGKQESRYAHLSEVLVQPGAWVEQGSVIGRVGSTGNSTGPHLHFEMLQATPQGWVAVDPGVELQSALARLVQALQTAQSKPQSGT